MKKNQSIIIFIVSLIFISGIFQNIISQKSPVDSSERGNSINADWGYGYDSTLTYLESIKESPFVKIDSIGASVEGRGIWMVTITDTIGHFDQMYRVTIHARTHPNEVQSQYLTQKMINVIIGETDLAHQLRHRVVFNIVPMYNPDGVELGFARENANSIDLERNWFVEEPEPEVAALKRKYLSFMNAYIPVRVALNMHGDSGADKGYFYFHHENGTSPEFVTDEKYLISMVQQHWPEGIADWDYVVSWTSGNPLLYPESWFWENYQESVMALTFEEIPTATRSDSLYDKTAYALLNGIADYLDVRTGVENVDSDINLSKSFNLEQNYPNPFNPSTKIRYNILSGVQVKLIVYDVLGREVNLLVNKYQSPGNYEVIFDASDLPTGTYFYVLTAGDFRAVKKMILLR